MLEQIAIGREGNFFNLRHSIASREINSALFYPSYSVLNRGELKWAMSMFYVNKSLIRKQIIIHEEIKMLGDNIKIYRNQEIPNDQNFLFIVIKN